MTDNKYLSAYPVKNSMEWEFGGLTKLELIAAMCLQGSRSNPAQVDSADSSLWILAQRDAEGLLAHLQNTEK